VFLIDCATPPLVWKDGQPERVPIFSGEREYDFPPPVARRGKVYLHARGEPATLPLFVGKPVRYCDYKLGEPDIDLWRFIVQRLGLMEEEPVELGGVRVSPREVLLSRMPPTLTPDRLRALVAAGRLDGRTMVLPEVTGRKDGRALRLTLWTESPDMRSACAAIPGASDISLLTSVPAATFALMLLRGEVGKTGVVLPEMPGPEARSIFRRGIGRYGIEILTRVEALDWVPASRGSPEPQPAVFSSRALDRLSDRPDVVRAGAAAAADHLGPHGLPVAGEAGVPLRRVFLALVHR